MTAGQLPTLNLGSDGKRVEIRFLNKADGYCVDIWMTPAEAREFGWRVVRMAALAGTGVVVEGRSDQ